MLHQECIYCSSVWECIFVAEEYGIHWQNGATMHSAMLKGESFGVSASDWSYTSVFIYTVCMGVHVFVWLTVCLSLGHFLSTTMPQDSPHQRIICKLWSSVIGRGPLMCPWAFSTLTESHGRTHTDNWAARLGFWKVTLRIAFNIYKNKTWIQWRAQT